MRTSAFVSKLKVILCRLRLAVLVENYVRLQKSALSSKHESHIKYTVLEGVYVQKLLIIYISS